MARFLRRFLGTAAASEGQAAPAAAAAVAAAADSAPCKDIDWSKGKVYHYKVLPRTYRLTEVSPEKRAKACGLKHQLEKVIFNHGVHPLKHPATGQHVFTPYLEKIVQPDDVDLSRFSKFVKPSEDGRLFAIARETNKQFVGSTSSVSSSLSMLFFLLFNHPVVNTENLSPEFQRLSNNFTKFSRIATDVILTKKDGVYYIDKPSNESESTVLSQLGQTMEKMLTLNEDDFEKILKSMIVDVPESVQVPESYRYVTLGKFLLRAQLDCEVPTTKGNSMIIDLKTRATVPIRLDIQNYKDYLNYRLTRNRGVIGTFEREYFDMMRAAFLKYNFQVRIGMMSGVMVAYHNTSEIFGFQYISRTEMDERLYGNKVTGDAVFSAVTQMFDHILTVITKKHPDEQNLGIILNALKGDSQLQVLVIRNPSALSYDKLKAVVSPANATKDTRENFYDSLDVLSQFAIKTTSTVNGIETKTPYLNTEDDLWEINYTIKDITDDKREAARALRLIITSYLTKFKVKKENSKLLSQGITNAAVSLAREKCYEPFWTQSQGLHYAPFSSPRPATRIDPKPPGRTAVRARRYDK